MKGTIIMGAPRVTLEIFIEKANNLHNGKFDYSKVDWVNTRIKVEIICPKHGSFMQTPFKHLQGQGCPNCRKNATVTREMFIERAKSMHSDKNYDYSEVDYKNMWTLVKIICPKHGEFEQTPAKHIKTGNSGCQGCPKCRYDKQRQTNVNRYSVENPMKKKEFADANWQSKKENGNCISSQPENRMYKELIEFFGEDNVLRNNADDPRYPFPCDFRILSLDLFIELNGTWFHGKHWFDENDSEDIKRLQFLQKKASEGHPAYAQAIKVWTERDLLKRQIAFDNNINYLVFWNNDLSDFHIWLENYKITKKIHHTI